MLVVVVKAKSVEWDRFILSELGEEEDDQPTNGCPCREKLLDLSESEAAAARAKPLRLRVDASVLSGLVHSASASPTFRRSLVRTLVARGAALALPCPAGKELAHLRVVAQLVWPPKLKMDQAGNRRLIKLLEERLELENVMAWLSTLGGAYSSLGEDFNHCAEVAGKISVQQFQIALTLGDPLMMARCKVYLAISLIQQGFVKQAKFLIMQQHAFAKSLPENAQDPRLVKMCQGVWAKLRYAHTQRRRKAKGKEPEKLPS